MVFFTRDNYRRQMVILSFWTLFISIIAIGSYLPLNAQIVNTQRSGFTWISTEEITVLTQTIHPILLQEPLERAAITTQILTALHVQEAIATLLVDLILLVLQVEICVPQEAVAEAE